MRVHDALLVEGTTKFAILCYGIFRFGELDSAFGALSSTVDPTDSRIYKFVDDDWPNGLVLCEVLVTPEDDVLLATGRTLTRMMELESCLAAACMYDGAFGTYDDLLAPEFAPHRPVMPAGACAHARFGECGGHQAVRVTDDRHVLLLEGIFERIVHALAQASIAQRDWMQKTGYTYGLHGTPTTFTLEERLASLEGGTHALLVPSGLAAIATVALALLKSGDDAVCEGFVVNSHADLHQLMSPCLIDRGVLST